MLTTRQLRNSHAWIAYDVTIGPEGEISWNGWQTGQGEIVQGPMNSGDGVLLPVNHDGSTRFVRLEAGDFQHPGRPCDAL